MMTSKPIGSSEAEDGQQKMSNSNDLTKVVERLRAFEGSEDLGDGDFSLLNEAADLLSTLQQVTEERDEVCRLEAEACESGLVQFHRAEAAEARVLVLEAAIGWALGENGDFPPRGDGQGAYWWRTELRRRSSLLLKEVR